MKLNLGCGKHHLDGWCNVDRALPADVLCDLDREDVRLDWPVNFFDELFASHLIEHIRNPLPLMQECWRVAKPGARFVLRCPYGGSDDADEDPTHVRRMFLQSFGYFSQPYHWRANYSYVGDWQPVFIWLVCPRIDGLLPTLDVIHTRRNQVAEMAVELHAVKPAREAKRELQVLPQVFIVDK